MSTKTPRKKRILVGCLVMESSEDFEQGLTLREDSGLPPGGILDWHSHSVFLFPSHLEARAAIERTEHYRLAYRAGGGPYPEKNIARSRTYTQPRK